jgi:hypothetical protein
MFARALALAVLLVSLGCGRTSVPEPTIAPREEVAPPERDAPQVAPALPPRAVPRGFVSAFPVGEPRRVLPTGVVIETLTVPSPGNDDPARLRFTDGLNELALRIDDEEELGPLRVSLRSFESARAGAPGVAHVLVRDGADPQREESALRCASDADCTLTWTAGCCQAPLCTQAVVHASVQASADELCARRHCRAWTGPRCVGPEGPAPMGARCVEGECRATFAQGL